MAAHDALDTAGRVEARPRHPEHVLGGDAAEGRARIDQLAESGARDPRLEDLARPPALPLCRLTSACPAR